MNSGGSVMQERYCSCGARIMVQFKNENATWNPVFWGMTHYKGPRLHVCPSCGNYLDINDLK